MSEISDALRKEADTIEGTRHTGYGPTPYTVLMRRAADALDDQEAIIDSLMKSEAGITSEAIALRKIIDAFESITQTGAETRATRYMAHDGRERAVLIWTDYEWLIKNQKEEKGQQ